MKFAERYAELRPAAAGSGIREELIAPGAAPEIELQARWFSGEFGRDFETTDGRAVRVIQFGVWNREAGPDFAETAISIVGGEPQRGAIELDVDARDWERHGHAVNPAYEAVVLHVFFESGGGDAFSRTLSNRSVPQVRLNLAAIAGPPPNPTPLAVPGRCVGPLNGLETRTVRELLEDAARFRMQRKAARLARLREAHGEDEALYQALAETLGYKANKLPFAILSQRAPVRMLRRTKESDALLFGLAGFLKAEDFIPSPAPETKAYLRSLWEKWWALRAEWESLAVPEKLWNLGGQRPANHPQRRLAALASIVGHWPKIRAAAAECDAAAVRKLLRGLRNDYWEHHYTVRSGASKNAMALIGASRITDMLANVFYPWAIIERPEKWEGYRALGAELTNRRVQVAAARLFSTDARQADLLKSAAMQQGLLQIYEDFCMHDMSDCAACLFPRQVAQWDTST